MFIILNKCNLINENNERRANKKICARKKDEKRKINRFVVFANKSHESCTFI